MTLPFCEHGWYVYIFPTSDNPTEIRGPYRKLEARSFYLSYHSLGFKADYKHHWSRPEGSLTDKERAEREWEGN